MPGPVDDERLAELLQALQDYRPARKRLLEVLDLPLSNRDPLAEFSDHLVRGIWGGTLAESRVQAGYDLVVPDGRKVQVRYLANTFTGVDQRALGAPSSSSRDLRSWA